MTRAIAAFAVAICVLFATYNIAAAHPKLGTIHPRMGKAILAKNHGHVARHHINRYRQPEAIGTVAQCDDRYCVTSARVASTLVNVQRHGRYVPDSTVIGSRPAGCPHAFCGCEASLYKFHRIIPSLNLAWNWVRKFPRASPAPGMAAARSHHVMILISQVSGSDWLVHDGNSGGHRTREHVRSIRGYIIVNPNIQLASR